METVLEVVENLEPTEDVSALEELKLEDTAETVEVTTDQLLQIRLMLVQAYNYEGTATVASSQNAIDMLVKASTEADPQRAMLMQSIGSLSAVVAQQETIVSNLSSQVQFCKETIAVLLLALEQIAPLTVEEPQPEPAQETAE
jgi:hypothetical protein